MGAAALEVPAGMSCFECGRAPARLIVRDRRLCAVCWHRGRIFVDLVRRLRAVGGPIMSSGSYVVGEKGPELFMPTTPEIIGRERAA